MRGDQGIWEAQEVPGDAVPGDAVPPAATATPERAGQEAIEDGDRLPEAEKVRGG